MTRVSQNVSQTIVNISLVTCCGEGFFSCARSRFLLALVEVLFEINLDVAQIIFSVDLSYEFHYRVLQAKDTTYP